MLISDALLGKRNRPLEMRWFMKKYIRPLAKKLGIPRIHWHALRHLNNSMMLDESVDVKIRMDRLGHVDERTNMIYTHGGDEAQRAASKVLWQRFQNATQKQTENKPVSLKVAGKVAEGNREEVSHELSY